MERNLKTDAKFSACRKYRYALWRTWDESKPYAMIIGLNPSTADEKKMTQQLLAALTLRNHGAMVLFA